MSATAAGLSTEDRLAIEELYALSVRHLDFPNPEAWAGLFTADGSFGLRNQAGEEPYRHVGHEALSAFVVKMAEMRAGRTRHWLTNILLEPTAEGVHGSAYLMMIRNNIDPPSVEILVTATYDDVIVHTDAGWRLRERTTLSDR